jgi:hypothetical protein
MIEHAANFSANVAAMRPIDRYDVIGAVIVCLVAALWLLHFLLPAPPPLPPAL